MKFDKETWAESLVEILGMSEGEIIALDWSVEEVPNSDRPLIRLGPNFPPDLRHRLGGADRYRPMLLRRSGL